MGGVGYNHRREVIKLAILQKTIPDNLFAEKEEIQRIVDELHRELGIVDDPTATAQRAREMMRASGIRPEENLISNGIIAAREGKQAVIHFFLKASISEWVYHSNSSLPDKVGT
jgi:hypothetical protein